LQVRTLLLAGADRELVNNQGQTPAMEAKDHEHVDAFRTIMAFQTGRRLSLVLRFMPLCVVDSWVNSDSCLPQVLTVLEGFWTIWCVETLQELM
jgi:hypothetical protein